MAVSCSICADAFNIGENDDEIRSTGCGHIFHAACLDEWLQRSTDCPQCRFQVDPERTVRLYFSAVEGNAEVNDAVAGAGDGHVLSALSNWQCRVQRMQLGLDAMKKEGDKAKVLFEAFRTKFRENDEALRLLREQLLAAEKRLEEYDRLATTLEGLAVEAAPDETVLTDPAVLNVWNYIANVKTALCTSRAANNNLKESMKQIEEISKGFADGEPVPNVVE